MSTIPARLTFRPLEPDDLQAMHRLHGDPTTNLHNPFGADPDVAATERHLDEWIRHRADHGFGYEAVQADGVVIGICGARHDTWAGHPVINLYWRLLPEHWGTGLSRPLALHALAIARDRPRGDARLIVARMREANDASRHVAIRLGLIERPDLARDGWVLFAAPDGGTHR